MTIDGWIPKSGCLLFEINVTGREPKISYYETRNSVKSGNRER